MIGQIFDLIKKRHSDDTQIGEKLEVNGYESNGRRIE